MDPITLTRAELYDLVWETLTSHLAKRFGLSDVGLAKTCTRLEIPRPSYGYWARKSAGGSVERTPLPACDTPSLQRITFNPDEPKTEETDEYADPEIRSLVEQEKAALPIVVADSLRAPHPLVARTRDALADVKPSKWDREPGYLHPSRDDGAQLLDITCSKGTIPRALRIMDALLKGLEKRGYTIGKPTRDYHRGTAAIGHGHEFVFRIREPSKRQVRPGRDSLDSRYDYVLTGELQFEIDNWPNRYDSILRDGVRKKLEDHIRELPLRMLLANNRRRVGNAEQAAEQRRQAELRRRQEEEEARKARREEQLRRRREQREELFNTAEQWRRTQTLREFIEAVRATAIERAKGGRLHPDTMRWLDWAAKTANRADPIEQMKTDSDRRKAKRKPK